MPARAMVSPTRKRRSVASTSGKYVIPPDTETLLMSSNFPPRSTPSASPGSAPVATASDPPSIARRRVSDRGGRIAPAFAGGGGVTRGVRSAFESTVTGAGASLGGGSSGTAVIELASRSSRIATAIARLAASRSTAQSGDELSRTRVHRVVPVSSMNVSDS